MCADQKRDTGSLCDSSSRRVLDFRGQLPSTGNKPHDFRHFGKIRASVSQRELTNSINKNHNLAHAERESHTNRERAGDDAINGPGNLNLVKCLAGTISFFRTGAST